MSNLINKGHYLLFKTSLFIPKEGRNVGSATVKTGVQIIPKAIPAVLAHPHAPKKLDSPPQLHPFLPFISQSCLSPAVAEELKNSVWHVLLKGLKLVLAN